MRTGDEVAKEAVPAVNENDAMDIDEEVRTFSSRKPITIVFSRLLQVNANEMTARPTKRPRLRARALLDSRFTTLQLTCPL
jgi:hypothetical protein